MQIEVLPRTALAFFVLLILTRLLGKKQRNLAMELTKTSNLFPQS